MYAEERSLSFTSSLVLSFTSLHHNWEQKLGGRDVYRVGEVWDRWEENGIQRGKGSVSRVPWRNGWQRYDIEAGYWLNGLSGKGSTWLE